MLTVLLNHLGPEMFRVQQSQVTEARAAFVIELWEVLLLGWNWQLPVSARFVFCEKLV